MLTPQISPYVNTVRTYMHAIMSFNHPIKRNAALLCSLTADAILLRNKKTIPAYFMTKIIANEIISFLYKFN